MADPDVVDERVEEFDEPREDEPKSRRSRVVVLVAVLLLLLLCVCSTTVDVWVNRDPDQVRFVARNLECLQCHTELIPQFSYPAVHDPFLKKECTVCHTRHGKRVEYTMTAGAYRTWQRFRTVMEWLPLKIVFWTYDGVAGLIGQGKGGEVIRSDKVDSKGEVSQLVLPPDELCWMCHGNLSGQITMGYPHNPFQKGFCTTCHDPHASKYRVLLVQDERDLCVTCHPMGPQLARKQVHPPAGGRFCTNCHHPHASDYRGILVDKQRDLCFMCHPSVAGLSLKSVQHNPFRYDNCTGCHEPHGSDYMPLLRKGTPPLCFDCHPGIARDFEKPSHHPVGEVELECESCHDPHAADYESLLVARDNNLCFECHGSAIQATYDPSAHWKNRLLCIRCHTPHGSAYAPLLRNSNPELCLECHGWVDQHDNQHPVRPVFYDRVSGKGMTCTTTCHNPHGTRHSDWMVKYDDYHYTWRLDGFCRQCHKAVGTAF